MEQYVVFKHSICQYAVPVRARDATEAIRQAFQENVYDREDHVGMYSPSDWSVWNNDLKEVKPERDKLQDLNGKAYRLFHEELRKQNARKNFTPGESFSGKAKDHKSNGKVQEIR